MPRIIAFVDDEEPILRALRRLFYGSEYDCLFFSSPDALLNHLESSSIDILITDIRMPEMDGLELMRRVKKIKPNVICVALSGYTDNRQILAALDSGLARLYVYKPWDNDELKRIVDGLRNIIRNLNQSSLMETINGLGSLPTFPSIYQNVVKLIESESSASEIAAVIETDPAIASKLLRIANTAYYGSHTGSVHQAIMMLGMTNVRQIILTNALFESAESVPYGRELWQHAALTNKGVAYLYHLMFQKQLPSHVGVVGLMHTIGLLLIATTQTSQYKALIEACENGRTLNNPFFVETLEKKIFGSYHTEVGSYLLNWWALPVDIIEATYHYRNPNLSEICNLPIVGIVHLVSHVVIKKMNLNYFQHPLNQEFLTKVGITESHQDSLEQYIDQLLNKREV